ncbi:MAG: DUF1566 domain-containing protein [Deltaproteobacteria bacterium]|nr:DUF1566 domain-containing protein [Deltaproteobacteria bacterium]
MPGKLLGCVLLTLLLFWISPLARASGQLPRTGQYSCYDQQGAAVDHAGTGQDGDLQAGAVWPDPRFTDNGDGTVTDHLTGLMWLQDGSCLGSLTWQGAMEAATGSEEGSTSGCAGLAAYKDWTLPDIAQLEALFNAEEVSAANWMNKHRFKNVQAGGYWSGTVGPNPYRAWSFHFDSGEVRLTGKVEHNYCLLVRPTGDRDDAVSVSDGAGRFVDNGDGTVTDIQSGLMWLKNGGCLERGSWQEALHAIQTLNGEGGAAACKDLKATYRDWALPNRNELRSIIDPRFDLPALAKDHPFIDLHARYWTSTTAATRSASAYELNVGAGELVAGGKEQPLGVWPVRPAAGRVAQPRIEDQVQDAGKAKDPFLLQAIGEIKEISWPLKRFTDHGDGTLTDNITGLMWLNDGECFAPERWENALKVVTILNTAPEKLKCSGYTARYADWRLPDLATMRELLAGADGGEPAAWLQSQGAVSIVARDYWVQDKNFLNLYYAWALNLRLGTPRNYSMAFELHVWPVRSPYVLDGVSPAPVIRGNGRVEKLVIKQGGELLLTAAVGNITGAAPCSFRIWYVAPDGKSRWLTSQGDWGREESDLYHGNLFFLEESPVFRGDTAELPTGDYTFSFAILPDPGSGGPEQSPFASQLSVTVTEAAVAESSPEPPAENLEKGEASSDEEETGDDEISDDEISDEELTDEEITVEEITQ